MRFTASQCVSAWFWMLAFSMCLASIACDAACIDHAQQHDLGTPSTYAFEQNITGTAAFQFCSLSHGLLLHRISGSELSRLPVCSAICIVLWPQSVFRTSHIFHHAADRICTSGTFGAGVWLSDSCESESRKGNTPHNSNQHSYATSCVPQQSHTRQDWTVCCLTCQHRNRLCDAQPQSQSETFEVCVPSLNDAQAHSPCYRRPDAMEPSPSHSHELICERERSFLVVDDLSCGNHNR